MSIYLQYYISLHKKTLLGGVHTALHLRHVPIETLIGLDEILPGVEALTNVLNG